MPGRAAIDKCLEDNGLSNVSLCLSEVATLLKKCLKITISDAQVAALFQAAHGNTTGKIRFSDFIDFVYGAEEEPKCKISQEMDMPIAQSTTDATALPAKMTTLPITRPIAANYVVPVTNATPVGVTAANVAVVAKATVVTSSTKVASGVPVAKATVVQVAKSHNRCSTVAKAVPMPQATQAAQAATLQSIQPRMFAEMAERWLPQKAPQAPVVEAETANTSATSRSRAAQIDKAQATNSLEETSEEAQGTSSPCVETSKAQVTSVTSALQTNLDQKGENAYYYAHRRHFEVPAEATVRTGPGLVAGGAPELLTGVDNQLDSNTEQRIHKDSNTEQRISWIRDYSWADAGQKVKVYVSVPQDVLETVPSDLIGIHFTAGSCELAIKSSPERRFRLDKLFSSLDPDKCSLRVEPRKGRVVLVLSKQWESPWPELIKSACARSAVDD